jgi:hypothetical protein
VILGGETATRAALEAVRGAPIADRLDGSHDWILLYVSSRAALKAALPAAAVALAHAERSGSPIRRAPRSARPTSPATRAGMP